jgi:hypothetical protein
MSITEGIFLIRANFEAANFYNKVHDETIITNILLNCLLTKLTNKLTYQLHNREISLTLALNN